MRLESRSVRGVRLPHHLPTSCPQNARFVRITLVVSATFPSPKNMPQMKRGSSVPLADVAGFANIQRTVHPRLNSWIFGVDAG